MHTTRKLFVFVFILVALIPTVNIFPWFTPAPWGQAILVRLLVPGLVSLFLLRLAREPALANQVKERLASTKTILLAFGAFLGAYVLALLFSTDFHLSFWGDPDRAWGILNYGLYVVLGLLAFVSLSKKDWRIVWIAMLAGGAVLTFIAFAQRFSFIPNLIEPTSRAHGTLGNPLFLGVYLTTLFFITLGYILKERGNRRIFLSGIALLMLAAITFTVSRTAFAGLGAGTLFFLLFAPVRTRMLRRIGLGALTIGVAALIMLSLHPQPPAFLTQGNATLLWERITPQNILQTERFAGWRIELQGIVDRPLLGYGPYNSWAGFNKHFEPEFVTVHRSTGWWDTAHNMYLDIAGGTGFIGLAFFLTFLALLLRHLSAARKNAQREEKSFFHSAQAALLAFLVGMTAAFFSTALYILFFLLLGYILFLIADSSPAKTQPANLHIRFLPYYANTNIRLILFATGGILLTWFWYATAVKPLVVNKEINIAETKATQATLENQRCQEALEIMERSFPQRSHFAPYHIQRHVDIVGQCLKYMPAHIQQLSQGAAQLLEEYHATRTYDPRSWILLAGYLNNLVLLSDDIQERQELLARAQAALDRAQELSPKRSALFEKRAEAFRLAGEYKKSQEAAAACLELSPQNGDCWFENVLSGIAGGEDHPIAEIREQGKKYQGTGFQESAALYYQLAEAYRARAQENIHNLIVAYEKLTHYIPNSLQYHATLAGLYRDAGQREKAIAQTHKMWRISPTPEMEAQINAFLQTL